MQSYYIISAFPYQSILTEPNFFFVSHSLDFRFHLNFTIYSAIIAFILLINVNAEQQCSQHLLILFILEIYVKKLQDGKFIRL